MKQVNPKVYNKDYYLNVCLGAEEFARSGGKKLHRRVLNLIKRLPLSPQMKVLDLGCGRGDLTLHLAKKVHESVGVDYSKDAIVLANKAKKNFPKSIQAKTVFSIINAKNLKFPKDYFDLIICIDVFEHLYKEEVEVVMKEIKRILKPNGLLFVHTGTNKTLYNYTYPYYIYPLNRFLTWIDQRVRKIIYTPLPKDPRTKAEKEQHVNEPTYGYLTSLFKAYDFYGKIDIEIGYIKQVRNFKTILYNFLIALYPLSQVYPLTRIFGWIFICSVRNKK